MGQLPAIFPAIATITAAFIAAFVAFLSSVLSKEQKTSEFRYTWLNSVLDDVAKFAGAAESISSTASSYLKVGGLQKAQEFLAAAEPRVADMLAAYYRARIRLYPEDHKGVHDALQQVKAAVLADGIPDPARVDPLVADLVRVSHDALKTEWGRVKKGELTFRLTKYISFGVIIFAVLAAVGFAAWAALH